MPVEVTKIRVDSTLNPGSGESMDIVNVSINCNVDHRQNAHANIPVPLPSGTIVQDVKKRNRVLTSKPQKF